MKGEPVSSNIALHREAGEQSADDAERKDEKVMGDDNRLLFIALVQCPLRRDGQSPAQACQQVIFMMADFKQRHPEVSLFVLPELAPIGYSEHTFRQFLLPKKEETSNHVHEDITAQMKQFCNSHNVGVLFGLPTYDENTERRYISHVYVPAAEEASTILRYYHKHRLCDYGDCAETRFFSSGDSLMVIEVKGWKFGVILCADMRDPFLCSSYVQQYNVDALLQPAAFSRDVSFASWKSFRETRAIENGIYFCGINYAGENFGNTSVNPPWIDDENDNHKPTIMGTEEGCLLVKLNRRVLESARSNFPFYRNIRAMHEQEKAV